MTTSTLPRLDPVLERPLSVQRRLRRDERAPQAARNFVSVELAARGHALDSDLVDTAKLLISELVTNAAMYAGRGQIRVDVLFDDKQVRFSVTDAGRRRAPAAPAMFDDDSEHGRGWFLVQALSAECGVQRIAGGNGNRVFFVLDADGGVS